MKIDLSIRCDCGCLIQEAVYCPEPNFSADRNIDSQTEDEADIYCPECSVHHVVLISNSYGGVDCSMSTDKGILAYDLPYYDEEEELDWVVSGADDSAIEIFRSHLASVETLLKAELPFKAQKNLQVMLYAHVVAAAESYLSKTFIQLTVNDNLRIRQLVESNSDLSVRPMVLGELFKKNDEIKRIVGSYLQDLIFHRLDKIKPMYKSVLGIDFGDITWFFRAVAKRHDCVHRAGYTKQGSTIEISPVEILDLMKKLEKFVNKVEMEASLIRTVYEDTPF
ncbi:hypothetical protein PSm6_44320 [Pseudomonas solani]|uniref:RiboL-PSP-HEPN domain-containing protein n=1 Tax=Pseudomonas solani TaxID=2731552 RepID=A0ABM7LEL8_9PSED|nr:hypothetical protein [Pseudomonas solani]BCD88025.1 hypothetical protein PSm6_44320 [Pseudomonas solani]